MTVCRPNFPTLFLAKRGAERRAARLIISWRAKRAYITRAWHLNLSSLVGVRLDVIQSRDVKVHYWFPGNRLPSVKRSVNHQQTQQQWIQQVAGNPRWERFTKRTPQDRERRL